MTIGAEAQVASPSRVEMIGTWSVDAASFHDDNIRSGRKIPADFFAFSITLKANGEFVATNVPADFFHTPQPAAPEVRGNWELLNYHLGTNLFLDFVKPSAGVFSTMIESRRANSSFIPSVRRVIYMSHHSGHKDSILFYLRKE